MRRLAPVLIAAMLCALATSAIAGGADTTVAGTAAKKCSKHKKKRHHKRGRKHRKHRKHRCGSPTGSGPGGGGSQGGQAKCNDASAPGRLGAREKEYSIQPTMPSVACG